MTTKKISKIHQRVMQSSGQSAAAINRQINKLVENSMGNDRSKDAEILANITQKWEDLNALREQLAETVMTFTGQVYGLINHAGVIGVLGDQRPHFDKLVQTFFADVKAFSNRIAALRVQHETRTGKIDNFDDYGTFTNLSLQYQNANDELNVLLAPTLSEMVLIVNDKVYEAHLQQTTDLLDPAVVSDIQPK